MIYFVYSRESNAIKIGYSKDSLRRLNQLQTGSANYLVFVAEQEGDQTTETNLHMKFDKHRKKGEWFYNDKEIENYIYKNTKIITEKKGEWIKYLEYPERSFLLALLIYSNGIGEIILSNRYKKEIAENLSLTEKETDDLILQLTRNNILFKVDKKVYRLNPYLFNLVGMERNYG